MSSLARIKSLGLDRLGPKLKDRQQRREDLPLSHWRMSIDEGDRVVSDGVRVSSLATSFGSPLHVVLGSQLEANISEAITPAESGQGADVFFSYKTNPTPGVLQRIHAGGIGAEVISAYEFWLARQLGVPGERIIYNGPAKSPESLIEAIEADTFLINANSVSDLALIERQAGVVGKRANVGIRVALPGMWAGQFGLDSQSDRVMDLVRHAAAAPTLNFTGLHFHRGVTMRHMSEAQDHVRAVLGFVDEVHEATGWHPQVLDLGGSLACPSSAAIPAKEFRLNRALGTDTLPPDPANCVTIGQMAREANRLTNEHFRRPDRPAPRLVLEPGRALVADTQMLLTTVLDVKDDDGLPHLIVDAGINIAESVPGEYHQLVNVSSVKGTADTSYRIAGPICTPADVLYNNWRVASPAVGHTLAIMDTGAYCVPFSTSFSFPRPAIVLVEKGQTTELRRGETFEDLITRDQISEPPSAGLGQQQ